MVSLYGVLRRSDHYAQPNPAVVPVGEIPATGEHHGHSSIVRNGDVDTNVIIDQHSELGSGNGHDNGNGNEDVDSKLDVDTNIAENENFDGRHDDKHIHLDMTRGSVDTATADAVNGDNSISSSEEGIVPVGWVEQKLLVDPPDEEKEISVDHDQDDVVKVKETAAKPTFLIILKSPRSGSTFLNRVLEAHPHIHNLFEPTISDARTHFKKCRANYFNPTTTTTPHATGTKYACSVSFNDYLKEGRYKQINSLIQEYDATIVIQLRANVVEKAISANKLWGELSKQKNKKGIITPPIARSIRGNAIGGLRTIRGFVIAERFIPSSSPSQSPILWTWYEDLVRDCLGSVKKIMDALDVPMHESSTSPLCATVHFRNDGGYNEAMVNELQMEDRLIPMIDAYKFNTEVDTSAIYKKLREETNDIDQVKLGFWRI